MASTFTANKSVEKPASGDYPGAWAAPANSNYDVLDQALGTISVIDLSGGSVVLSTAQARSAFLNFTGALPSNVTVTIPCLSTSPGTIVSGGFYAVENACTNSSIRTVTLQTTVVGQQIICAPPGEAVDIKVEGTGSSQAGSLKYRNLDRIGSYWDYCGSSLPAWVSGCTIPPYLVCDGTSFSSIAFPVLAMILGGVTLPDARGRFRAALNSGTGRITSASGGVDGNTPLASGGAQTTVLSSQHVPPVPITDPGHQHVIGFQQVAVAAGGVGASNLLGGTTATANSCSATTGITAGNATPAGFSLIPPTYIGGITLIRSG